MSILSREQFNLNWRAPNIFYHLTNEGNFNLNAQKVPEDAAISIYERSRPGLYLSDHPHKVNRWLDQGYIRPFVAQIHVPDHLVQEERWHGESFLPAEHFGSATVHRVTPLDAWSREMFGRPGPIEERLRTSFDTREPLPISVINSHTQPFPDYTFNADARDMGASIRRRHVKWAKAGMKAEMKERGL